MSGRATVEEDQQAIREWHEGRPRCGCGVVLDYTHPTNRCDPCSRLLANGEPPRPFRPDRRRTNGRRRSA